MKPSISHKKVMGHSERSREKGLFYTEDAHEAQSRNRSVKHSLGNGCRFLDKLGMTEMMVQAKGALAQVILLVGFLFALGTLSCLGAPTITQQIDPPEVNVGEEVTVTIQVQNGGVTSIRLPHVDGLEVIGNNTMTGITLENGAFSSTTRQVFTLIPTRPGDFIIPPFDIHTQEAQILHVQAMKLHVLGSSAAPNSSITPAPPSTAPAPSSNGPVIMPPSGPIPPDNPENSVDTTTNNTHVPIDKDGRPAKVFMSVTPTTTDAYVGEAIPTRIEFYIRLDVMAGQDSLPTINGSDFLMNNLSVRPNVDEAMINGEPYRRETWVTAISAPKSGDFPFQMKRDTYWTKPSSRNGNDPFSFFFNRPSLAHGNVGSNPLTFHIRSLPEEGRPANFSGAIGHFKVTGVAAPSEVTVGEPVTLHFGIGGEGNFDYVKCPSLTADPAWKAYISSSKIEYQDETHTQGIKTFEQAVIPQKNGNLPLPAASFSYFDSTAKQYVTVPISLPAINVTGSVPAIASTTSDNNNPSITAPVTAPSSELVPNRLEAGPLYRSLTPLYRKSWFWIIQASLILLLLVGASLLFFRPRFAPDQTRAERALRKNSLLRQEDAMSEAVRQNDPQAFFLAARNAIQLQLGAQWHMKPEAITLAEIRQRDPQRAEILEPLFRQIDEIIYSGGQINGSLNLAEWELHVRKDLLQPQYV
jgi:hypothetical protein